MHNQNVSERTIQLFCFSHAGGSGTFYAPLEKALGPQIEVVKLEYSGHGTRHKEPLYQSFEQAAKDLCEIMKANYSGGDYGLFGYSMGSICATECLKKLQDDSGFPCPKHIFLAAHEPHTMIPMGNYPSEEQEEYLRSRTIQFGGIPEKLLHNDSFWRMYLPIYRADYSMIAKYDFDHLEFKTVIPTTCFYSETDTPLQEMKKWSRYYVGQCEFMEYDGSHFFIKEHLPEIANVIMDRLS